MKTLLEHLNNSIELLEALSVGAELMWNGQIENIIPGDEIVVGALDKTSGRKETNGPASGQGGMSITAKEMKQIVATAKENKVKTIHFTTHVTIDILNTKLNLGGFNYIFDDELDIISTADKPCVISNGNIEAYDIKYSTRGHKLLDNDALTLQKVNLNCKKFRSLYIALPVSKNSKINCDELYLDIYNCPLSNMPRKWIKELKHIAQEEDNEELLQEWGEKNNIIDYNTSNVVVHYLPSKDIEIKKSGKKMSLPSNLRI